MKFSIVSKSVQGWHVEQLVKACQKFDVPVEVVHFHNPNTIVEDAKKLGDVVIWRASKLGKGMERAALGEIIKGRKVINITVLQKPYLVYKFVQQVVAKNDPTIPHIETYQFAKLSKLAEAVDENILQFPFIAKPNYGSQGIGIHLIKSKSELMKLRPLMGTLIFQNFIKNTGDWRVIIIDGKSIGVMKRIDQPGHFLNNLSQGGSSEHETDPETVEEVTRIAERMAKNLGFSMCGIDVIKDDATGQFYFLELNSAPQWDGENGFQAVTGVNVAEKLVQSLIAES